MSRACGTLSLEQAAALELDDAAIGIIKPAPLERNEPGRSRDSIEIVAGEPLAPVATGQRGRWHADDGDRAARRGGLEAQHAQMIVPVNDEFGAVLAQDPLQRGR